MGDDVLYSTDRTNHISVHYEICFSSIKYKLEVYVVYLSRVDASRFQ